MEKVTLFLCDICGTFDSDAPFKINYNELTRFIDNLNKLIIYNKTDKIIFSFVTTENLDTVIQMEEKLKNHTTNNKICMGEHIYCNGTKSVNKPYDIIKYIQRLKLIYNIDNIYYADDCEFYHILLNELKDCYCIEHKFKSIIPKNNGLKDVNDAIETSLKDKVLSFNYK